MQADLDTLKRRIVEAATRSGVAAQLGNVAVEADRDEDGADFLRVIVQVKDVAQVDEAEFDTLLEAIERAVGDVDERYPSVRFSDAA